MEPGRPGKGLAWGNWQLAIGRGRGPARRDKACWAAPSRAFEREKKKKKKKKTLDLISFFSIIHSISSYSPLQVLDDSTDKTTRDLVDDKVAEWRERGVNVYALRRTNRSGYKAGALKEGLEELADFDYVAIFDADFKPEPDFLTSTVPYLIDNPEVGYVQARWTFTNPDESYLTKAQEISLNFHVKCEQWVHFAEGTFFNFNGTAGVWRRKTIVTVGGWQSRTTVEDMDLSLRTFINGWKAIYLTDVTCVNELPAQFAAYRKQQHRWTCGPIQLWLKANKDIWASSLPLAAKINL